MSARAADCTRKDTNVKTPHCQNCKRDGHYQTFCPIRRRPRIKPIGRRGELYNRWRDEVAIPFLDATYGHKCAQCPETRRLEVAHIQGRGAYPQMKMLLDNVRWLCWKCHRKEHGVQD